MLYKTLFLKNNPNAEYQRRKGVWYKRPIGSKQMWYKVDSNGQQVLSNVFQGKNALFFYSNTAIVGGALLIGLAGYMFWRKRQGLSLLPKLPTQKPIV